MNNQVFSSYGLKVTGVADLVELLRPVLMRLNSNKLIQYAQDEATFEGKVDIIQYWSQEQTPLEIQKAFELWDEFFANSKRVRVLRFSKKTAFEWLGKFAPEYQKNFASSIHPAMEADIFRVVYAQKFGCVWLDADHVPPKHPSERHFNVASFERWAHHNYSSYLMKHWRDNVPYINNSIFSAKKNCPLGKALSQRILQNDPTAFSTAAGISSYAGPKAYTDEADKILSSGKIAIEIDVYGRVNIFGLNNEIIFTISNLFRFLGARKDYADIMGGDVKWEYKKNSHMDWRSV